jgi:hypothetical protein
VAVLFPPCILPSSLGGVGHCFAWHVQVSFGFYLQKNLYIVGCVQCIWDKTAYFLLPELKYYYENMNKWMLYLWLLEITKVRIKFQNYLFKADERISHHLGHNSIFPADRIRMLP